ncbi:hypothetical protein CVD28_20150 [Bacillus sp. M6-12]|nr:hypothetical protein CVD28_20150 [Bacillus sp. M6-12]
MFETDGTLSVMKKDFNKQ